MTVEPKEINRDVSISSLISPVMPPQALQLKQPIKLGIMASGNGSNFEAIASAIQAGQLNAQIQVLIYNNPNAKVRSRAEGWNVPAVLLDHRDFKRREDLDRSIVEVLREYQVELVVMAGWMRVATLILIDAFPDRLINIHPSLLPSFRGIRAVEQALDAGVKITGCTVHLVSLEVDNGPILVQAAVPILPEDTPETLHWRIQVLEHSILPSAIALAAKRVAQE
jgi:phosphoribosylglycinamide formyltransferase 1